MVKLFTKISAIIIGAFLLLGGYKSNAQYCTPLYSSGCGLGDDIKDVILNGANGTLISNLNNPCPASGYQDYTTSTLANMTCTLIMGMTYSGNVTTNYAGTWESVKVWIDFNQNSTFEATEVVATLNGIGAGMPGAISVAIPVVGVVPGNTRMRVRLNYITTAASIDPCTSVTWGECHDYKVTIIAPGPPNNAGVTSLVTPNAGTEFCSNSFQPVSVAVMNLGSNAIDSVRVNWSVNGVLQTPVSVNTPLAYYMDSTVVLLGDAFFPDLNPVSIHAWTSMPNGVIDPDFSDDSLKTSYTADKLGVYVDITPNDTIICSGSTVVLDAGAHPNNPIYIWNNAQLTQTITVGATGSYIVRVQNNDGCIAYDTAYVELHPDPVVNSIPIIENADGSFTFNVLGAAHFDEYKWDFGDGNSTNWSSTTPIPAQNHSYGANGEYTVNFCLRNLCREVCVTRKMNVTKVGLGINAVSALQKQFSVYPNPAKSEVTISNDGGFLISNVTIVNVLGQQIGSVSVNKLDRTNLDISHLVPGLYSLVIETDKGRVTKKLEVIK